MFTQVDQFKQYKLNTFRLNQIWVYSVVKSFWIITTWVIIYEVETSSLTPTDPMRSFYDRGEDVSV